MLKGIKKLPVKLDGKEAITIYKKLSQVNKKIGRLNAGLKNSIINNQILSLLSYNESVQSTKIEGTQVTFNEIMEIKEKKSKISWQQQEVMNYKNAIDYGFDALKSNAVISTRLIKELHRILMKDDRGTTASGGEFRKIQNFIGPDNKIENASYIPVEAQQIDEYMTNLEFFINGTNHESLKIEETNENESTTENKIVEYINFDSDPLLRIAVTHAQFESIHPFLDGNGRLGRILIALLAVQEDLMYFPIFFVSEELEKERIRYYNTLNATRGDNPNWFDWIMFFLHATEKMCDNFIQKIDNVEKLANKGLQICTTESQKSAWLATFQAPIITASETAKYIEVHPNTAKKSLDFLTENHLLDRDNSVKRNRKYYNYELLRVIQ